MRNVVRRCAKAACFKSEIPFCATAVPGTAGVYNVHACADGMRKSLDRWVEYVAGIAAPRAKPVRAKHWLARLLG